MIKKEIDYKKYINYMLIAYAFSVPISKAATNFFEILLLLTWVYEGNWKVKWDQYKRNYVSLFLIIFLAYSILSILWSDDTAFAISYVLKYRHFLIILIFYSYLEQKYVEKTVSAFLLAMLLSEIMSYGIFFELWHYKNVLPNDPAPFMDHISYSAFLSITGAILFAKLLYVKKNIYHSLGYALFFITLTINMFVNAGRTGQIMYLISLFIIASYHFKNKFKAFFTVTALVASILFLAYNFSPNFHNRASEVYSDVNNAIVHKDFRGSLTTRISLWMVGIDKIINIKPILGEGISSDNGMKDVFTYVDQNPYLDRQHFSVQGDHHNMFITITIIYGFIGLLLILSLFYSIFQLKFKSIFFKSLNISFIIGFTLWSMTGNNFHGMNPMTYFTLFTGLLIAVSKLEMQSVQHSG